MITVYRIEHRERPCLGPSKLFGLGIYAPTWGVTSASPSRGRPNWMGDEALRRHNELRPLAVIDLEHINWHVNADWYFAFASLEQLEAWFPVRLRRRHAYLKHGAVIRTYRAARVLFGAQQCVVHRASAERIGTFHIYRPTEAV